jgi:hypothetical protein
MAADDFLSLFDEQGCDKNGNGEAFRNPRTIVPALTVRD